MQKTVTSEFASSLDGLSRNLYQHLVKFNPNRNIIFSPLSIQICSGMLRMGSEENSNTTRQLDKGLHFNSKSVKELAERFYTVLNYYQQCITLHMGNKVYVMNNYQLRQEFNEILTQKFFSPPESIDFSHNQQAADTINGWVESKTNHLIKNLVSPAVLNSETKIVLVNAIHFKGEWSIKFAENATQPEDFSLDDKNKIRIPMMNSRHYYFYADLPKLDAKALRMAYKDTELFMLVILPNKVTGLKQLSEKLQSIQLGTITSLLSAREVAVKLPKFKVVFEQELTPVFQKLGIERIFGDHAELGQMLEQNVPLYVSKIAHKVFIEVNEEGTEAAAASSMVFTMRSAVLEPRNDVFHANHPFYYVIYDAEYGCLFVGNLLNPVNDSAKKKSISS